MQLILCCPEGGDYPVEGRLARVAVNGRGEPFVEFPCPGCGSYVTCPLEDHAALRLIGLGIRATAARPPAELAEVHDGPPLSSDELLDLHLFLGRPDWLAQLERELAEQPPPPS